LQRSWWVAPQSAAVAQYVYAFFASLIFPAAGMAGDNSPEAAPAPLDLNASQSQIQDFLEVLDKHRIECERQGKYEEAELASTRLEQLRQHEENRRRDELRSQQLAERLGVEEAHMTELQEFNDIWDKKVAEFESHARSLQETLASRHKQEHEVQMDRLRRETEPRTPRWSKDLLNLRKIQETLAKQKKYAEAEKVKAQADKVEAQEHAMWKAKREARIAALEEQFLHKQQLEMGGLLKRITSGREEQKGARKSELERLLQRYHNVKTQLESQQKIIQQRVERYPIIAAPNASQAAGPRPGSAAKKSLGSSGKM
jgi:chromosome segregation ATPase